MMKERKEYNKMVKLLRYGTLDKGTPVRAFTAQAIEELLAEIDRLTEENKKLTKERNAPITI